MKISAFSLLSLVLVLIGGCVTEKTDPAVRSAETCGTCGNNSASTNGVTAAAFDFGGVAVASIELPDGRRFAASR